MRASLRDWAMDRPLRVGVVTGALFGLIQAIWPVVAGNGAVAGVFGLLSGIPFGAFMGLFAAKMNERP